MEFEFKNKQLIAYLFICISLLFTFSMVFLGLNFTDSFYYLKNAVSSCTQALIPLSQLVTSFFIKTISGEFWWSRFIVWFLRVVLVFIPYFVLFDKNERRNGMIWIGFSLISIPTWYILGPDIYTSILLVCLITIFIKCSKTKVGLIEIICVALINVISIYIRFPNILSVIFSMFYIGLINKRISSFYAVKSLIVFSFAVTVIYYFFSLILDINPLYEGLQAIITANVPGQETSHSFLIIFKSIFRSVCRVLIIFLIVLLINYFDLKKTTSRRHLYLLGIFLIVIYLLFRYVLWYPYSIVFREIVISICIFELVSLCKIDNENIVVSSIIICFAFVAPFGSDTGLFKAADVLICFIPFILVHQERANVSVSQIVVAGMYLICALWCGSQCYEDKRPHKLQVMLTSNNVKYIITTHARKEMIDDVESCYNSDRDYNDIIFYGWCSHLFRYLYKDIPMNADILYSQLDFHMDENDIVQIQILEQYLNNKGMSNVAIYVMPYYPESFSANYCMDGSVIDKKMKELNFSREDRKSFVIYRSNDKSE